MKEISLENLKFFRNIFHETDRIKHFVIILTIENFIKRLEEFPDLKNRVKLFAPSDEWRDEGFFFLSVSVMRQLKFILTFFLLILKTSA